MEPFTLVEETVSRPGPYQFYDAVVEGSSAKTADPDLQHATALREAFPEMVVTGVPVFNLPLRPFAAAGFASCEIDKDTDSVWAWRGFVAPTHRGQQGSLAEQVHFAKYRYVWNGEAFILYIVGGMQYILTECREGEHALGPSKITDALIKTVGAWLLSDEQVIWVFDGYWTRSKELYNQVMKANWDKVILDEDQKKDLTQVTNKFFNSKQIYEDLGVPWKRGLLFHGPPGNGKTISIKALMHTLLDRKHPIPTLYVKSAPNSYALKLVFAQARRLTPCMLVLEDIETIVTPATRSYFFNEMDGLENNDGLFVVGSTNYLDRLDPGLSKRPSRFDRKYLFPLPNEHERTLYCEYWRHKLQKKPSIDFPKKLSPEMARITSAFSFAFLQECFIATLLILARHEMGAFNSSDDKDLEEYEIWRVFRQQADILRKEVQDGGQKLSPLMEWRRNTDKSSVPLPPPSAAVTTADAMRPGCKTCSHCACSERHLLRATSFLPTFKNEEDDVVLNELPLFMQKRLMINPAALEAEGSPNGPWTGVQ
ncbi:P-loop containing nucleoside triphosphate hydrolase protein [Polychaeton citri CBS 116435]|uniref:P-loop containing nucleoside triphosphate hydrolase protein n=1 Tax=Polychaeton citri CBS 116435 TaxID=1314669 RepID=A0A9P4URC1_9PEZI|nr:P-loop containing nucleoside triphosphate hydrolase protein [Polychaeton citri CBS 116435]